MSERGEQPRADGQPTNQAQGGAQQGGYAGQAQAGGQESIGTILGRPKPKSYMQSIVGSMGVVGILLGVGTFLVAQAGGRSLLPGIVQSVSVQGVDQAISATHQLTLAYVTNELAIFLAFMMAPLFGALVALRMDDTERAKLATSGVGVAIGTFVFVVIVAFVASMFVPSASQFTSGLPTGTSAVGGFQGASFGLGSVNFGNLVINGVLMGIAGGLAASATGYFLSGTFD